MKVKILKIVFLSNHLRKTEIPKFRRYGKWNNNKKY